MEEWEQEEPEESWNTLLISSLQVLKEMCVLTTNNFLLLVL